MWGTSLTRLCKSRPPVLEPPRLASFCPRLINKKAKKREKKKKLYIIPWQPKWHTKKMHVLQLPRLEPPPSQQKEEPNKKYHCSKAIQRRSITFPLLFHRTIESNQGPYAPLLVTQSNNHKVYMSSHLSSTSNHDAVRR